MQSKCKDGKAFCELHCQTYGKSHNTRPKVQLCICRAISSFSILQKMCCSISSATSKVYKSHKIAIKTTYTPRSAQIELEDETQCEKMIWSVYQPKVGPSFFQLFKLKDALQDFRKEFPIQAKQEIKVVPWLNEVTMFSICLNY